MAIDPATAKLIAKAAVDVVTDEEKRRRMLILILAPTIGLLLLIALIVYIITSPLSLLLGWLLPNEISVIEDFQKDYGYNQNIGIYETDYLESNGQNYESIVLTDGATTVTYYNQMDERWSSTMYGTSSTIGEAGCGPTSMSIVISTLTGEAHDPWSLRLGLSPTDTAVRGTALIIP